MRAPPEPRPGSTSCSTTTTSEILGVNSRLHWIPKAGREGFIVLNHNVQDYDKDNEFHSALSDLNVKFSYTFRF